MIKFTNLRKDFNSDTGTIADHDKFSNATINGKVIASIRKRHKGCLRLADHYSVIIGTVIVARYKTLEAAKRDIRDRMSP